MRQIDILRCFLLEIPLPQEHIDTLNTYLDDLLQQEDRKSQADRLVGQIKNGEQLFINHEDARLVAFDRFTLECAQEYIGRFIKMSETQFFEHKRAGLQTDEMWSVHSYAGDYNPIHDHGTKTLAGLSWTTWTKLPPQIADKTPNPSMLNASGAMDGNLVFCYSPSEIRDPEQLKMPQVLSVVPKIGVIYMFPSWSPHMVYPFDGEGERRTVAGNINIWLGKQDEEN